MKYIPVDFLLTERFDSIEKIEAIQIPVLFIHGESDEKVPAWMTKKLHEERASAKEICLIPKAGHENCCQIDETTYVERFSKFLNACMKAPKSLPAPVP